MVRDEEKQLIRQCVEALREGIPGFRSRRPQMEMIAAVANTLSRCRAEDEQAGNGDHLAIVEAGTGTGKSFGALVPALVMAKSRNKRLVVSSSTVALQHQYAEKDAPSLQRLLPIPFTFAVAKGRRRYACTVKLQAEGKLAGQAGLDLVGEGAPEGTVDAPRRVAAMRELLVTFDTGRWSGDRDELPLPVVDEVWERITTDRQGCAGSKCPEFARCPFQAARQRVKEADLVIANHDLVLSAIDMDGASVLPSPHETIYVFDEAHSLAAKAVEHFSARHALRGAMEWLEGACNAVRDAVLGLRLDEQLIRDSRASAERMERALRDLHSRIHGTNGFEEKRARRFRSGPLPDWCKSAGGQVLAAGEELQKTFASLREHVLEKAPSVGALATQVLSVLGFYVVRLDNLVDTWQLMLTEQPEGSPPIARWIPHRRLGRSRARRDRPSLTRSAGRVLVARRRSGRPGRAGLRRVLDQELDGVAIAARPVSRHLDDGITAEVRRIAVDPSVANGCTKLLGAIARSASAMGYRRLVTYTSEDEDGASLYAAGWDPIGRSPGGRWGSSKRPRDAGPEEGRKVVWVKVLRGDRRER